LPRHYVGGANTNLENNKTSSGYRLILNNVLFPSARNKAASVNNLPGHTIGRVFPNPMVKYVNIELKSSDIKRIKVACILAEWTNCTSKKTLNWNKVHSLKSIILLI
jgi:hypothetical protein